ncbi:MAG: hypothetical protein JSW62_05285 [Thermoplasmatales archaeon]|nr:MAG: hypothetical protein JSW62_05285 [Thermoplasmatales archaeon]
MDVTKNVLIVVAIALCAIGSVGATYFYMGYLKQTEIDELEMSYENTIGNLVDSIVSLEYEVYDLEQEINNAKDALSDAKTKWHQTNLSLQENISELQLLQSGDKYNLHDPTYNEVERFIANDETDEIEFDEENFDCENFAQTVNSNAENQGIRCAFVIMYFEQNKTGHAIVGFNTVDQGMVYIEPQSDEWVENFEIGNDYWTDCVVPSGNYYYEDAPNDTIKEILIYW